MHHTFLNFQCIHLTSNFDLSARKWKYPLRALGECFIQSSRMEPKEVVKFCCLLSVVVACVTATLNTCSLA